MRQSINYFRNHLHRDWNPNSTDNGIDLSVEISEGNQYQGLEFIIQIKSSAVSDLYGDFERQTLALKNYNYLWRNLRIAVLIKYIEEEDEAYWILLKIFQCQTKSKRLITIKIPRANTLSTIDWSAMFCS